MSLREATGVERVSWKDFLAGWRFRQGQHSTMVAPTGRGKTTLALQGVLPRREYVCIFGTKAKDPVLSKYARDNGYLIVKEWPPPATYKRVILWPKIGSMGSFGKQRQEIREAMEDIYERGGWTVYLDELTYLTRFLSLGRELETLWQQGRSLGITVVAGTQRPAWVPLAAYDQASHLFLWRNPDRRSMRRLSEISAALDPREVEETLESLERHDFLYCDTHEGRMVISRVEVVNPPIPSTT